MFIDHFSKIFLNTVVSSKLLQMAETGQITYDQFQTFDYFVRFKLFAVGTIAFPIFCFLLTEGFLHTRNRKRYISSMLVFALISELPFDIGFFSSYSKSEGTFPFYFAYQNVFFTLFLGLVCLCIIEKLPQVKRENPRNENIKALLMQLVTIAIAAVVAELLKCDYGSQGIIFIVGFYLLRQSRILQALGFLVLYMATTGNQPTVCTIIAALLLLLYNGKRGKGHFKYAFYWFYPVHIFLLYLATLLVA